jgi:protein tyrosine phosphatase (PTP) superfamily phosphohydrolase (DUF442 family)
MRRLNRVQLQSFKHNPLLEINMKNIITVITLLFLFIPLSACSKSESIEDIKNFTSLSPVLASAGMPSKSEFSIVQKSGYQHIINLIPGDFSSEKKNINSLGMSFDQIAVDWNEPTLADFKHFVRLMNTYKLDKVLVHCRLNYRASAFAYLYQTTQLGLDESIAQSQMQAIWEPDGTWLKFIKEVQKNYNNPK